MSSTVMSVAQIRAAEEHAMETVSEATLMARAADAVAAEAEMMVADARGRVPGARVAVLVGAGNNGGDALLAAARLQHRGCRVTAVLVSSRSHEESRLEALDAGVTTADAHDFPHVAQMAVERADLVIDGIVGIGSAPGLRSPADALVAAIDADTPVLAVDIPSGLDADSGAADASHVRADATVTFTALKVCLVEEPAAAQAGRVIVADVGVPRG